MRTLTTGTAQLLLAIVPSRSPVETSVVWLASLKTSCVEPTRLLALPTVPVLVPLPTQVMAPRPLPQDGLIATYWPPLSAVPSRPTWSPVVVR